MNSPRIRWRMAERVSKKIENLTGKFRDAQADLQDADQWPVRVAEKRSLLKDFRRISYDVNDVLDEWNTINLKSQIERAEQDLLSRKKVSSIFLSSCFHFKDISSHYVNIARKVEKINEELDMFDAEYKARYWIGDTEVKTRETTSLTVISGVHGLDEEKDDLVSKLLSEPNEQVREHLSTISIVGMAGIGKTTLAQLVYNDEKVCEHFHRRIWICVGHRFDILMIGKVILETLGFHVPDNLMGTVSVLEEIHRIVMGENFLLVLDHVWGVEDDNNWESLYTALNNGCNGNRILITTRKKTVAQRVNSTDIIIMKELTEEKSSQLFREFAFAGMSHEENKGLEKISRLIIGKCEGLPLAIKMMGSLLRFQRTRMEWRSIADCEMWELLESERSVSYSLLLSYCDLTPMSRRCFCYCSVFPKNYLIPKDKLIKLWMARGCIESKHENVEMEMEGEACFDELAASCFFQVIEKDGVRCKMHKIVHDFATYLTKQEGFTMEVNNHEEPRIRHYYSYYHLTVILSKGASFPVSICSAEKLRTLLVHYGVTNCSSVSEVLPKLCDELTCLRALDLSGKFRYEKLVIEIPGNIEKLLHLRYLNLSFLKIEELPETLCELCNLQTLELNSCTKLKKLPQAMRKLISLRHLGNSETSSLSYMPKGIEGLTALRTLSEFVVSGASLANEAATLRCLRNLKHLRGSLSIRRLGNVANVDEVVGAELRNKENLLCLFLNFEKEGKEKKANGEHDEQVLEALQPPPELKRLEIRDYNGKAMFPTWIALLNNLSMLSLHDCINFEHLPPLGKLPSLESLSLCSMASVKTVGDEFLGIDRNDDGTYPSTSSSSSSVVVFPKLKTLKFLNMDEWDEWELLQGIEIMPRLRSLSLVYCPKLTAVPDHLLQKTTLEELNINWCSNLKERYVNSGKIKVYSISKIMVDGEDVQRHHHSRF